MQTHRFRNLFIAMIIALVFAAPAAAQTGWGFQQYEIAVGGSITTATVPVGSYVGPVGSSSIYNPDGSLRRVILLTYYTPLSPDPQPMESHYFVAGPCQGLKAPDGYRKVRTWRNIYGVDNPETGTWDNTTEFCVLEIVPR